MAIDYISIKGFKSILSLEKLTLRPLNIVIGPNGSGKSNFIGVFSFLHAIREGRLQEYVGKIGGAENILHFGSKSTQEISIHVSFEDGVNQYQITLHSTDTDELLPVEEVAFFWDKNKYPAPYAEYLSRNGKEAGISNKEVRKTASFVRDYLGSWRLYHFHDTSSASPMKKMADLNDNRHLRSDASNLSSFLFNLQQKHNDSYKLICNMVRRVTPFFEDFHLAPLELNPDKIRLEWRHKNTDKYFDANALSDGTLRFISLSTLFLQPQAYLPSVILIDEPELGLHPYAIAMLASLMKTVSQKTQVIVSTQSPLLLDHFEPEDLLVAERIKGATHLRRLEPDKLKLWLKEYSLGQLWEKNELGGRPSEE